MPKIYLCEQMYTIQNVNYVQAESGQNVPVVGYG